MRAPECILLSSLLNNENVLAARGFGISPHHFRGYRREYQWLLDYVETYGTEPSWDAFLAEYPDFRGQRPRWTCAQPPTWCSRPTARRS